MAALARLVTGRRSKWLVIVAWIAGVLVMAPFASRLREVTTDDVASFLPESAQSTEVQHLLRQRFPGGDAGTGLIVYRRRGGLTPADAAKVRRDAARVARAIPVVGRPVVPFTRGAPRTLVSRVGDTAYTVLRVPEDFRKAAAWGRKARAIVKAGAPPGLGVYVTGDLGFSADFQEVFSDIDAKLLAVTVALVLVLLGAIYRSPLIAIIPIVVVGLATVIADGLIYVYADAAGNVNSNSTTILVVLMFGVGTDYCLLLVSRYREELQRVPDKHVAMERALRRAGPALLASGCTVIAAMLVLLLAKAGSTKGLGPVSAIGVAAVLLAGLTLLPALLTITGRRAFWPMRSRVAYRGGAVVSEEAGIWRRVGDRVLRRPALALAATAAIFGVFALGLLSYREDYSIGGAFRTKVESVTGFQVLSRAFPAGALGPTTVVVRRAGAAVTAGDVTAVRRRLRSVDGVAAVGPPQRSKDGRLARVDVVFRDDPYSDAALARVEVLRHRLDHLGPGVQALVGAGSAVQEDFNKAAERDLRVIVPVALLVIAVILGVLLRAIVAPIVLIATVMASLSGTLGLSLFFFIEVLGDRGVDASLPTYAFIFLVALGIDYTIFLMSRVREEARVHGTRQGTLRALAATGPVITSAGIILAGTFSVLMTLPVTFAFNIGFMVAVGILLDTFIVRTVMVPAAVELLGDRIWWPSAAAADGGRALREHVEPEPEPAPAERRVA